MESAARFQLTCPRCAGPISGLDGADALACPHCRERFFLAGGRSAGWMVPPNLQPADAVLAAKRWLRAQGRRVTGIGEPSGALVPLYWVRGLRFVWEIVQPTRVHAPRESGSLLGGLVTGAALDEAGTTSDIWEARSSVRAYTHAIPAHALLRGWRGGGVRLQSARLELLDPDQLPDGYRLLAPEVSYAEAEAQAERWLEGRRRVRRAGLDATDRARSADLQERINVVAVPAILVPFVFRDEDAGIVVVDGIHGRVMGASEEPVPGDEPATRYLDHIRGAAPRLLPLECPECGWELELRERDRLHPCGNCGLCWEIVDGERVRVRQWFLRAEEPPTRWLPFWVFGEREDRSTPPSDAAFSPAYEARHLEEQMRLAAMLTRRCPEGPWQAGAPAGVCGAAHGSAEAAGWHWAVRGALSRNTLGEFSRFVKAEVEPTAPPSGLVWLPFRREGGDLVQAATGTRIRADGADPWPSRRAA
jgi:predicted RNA-binding Zn-ribbon protein involved in translation (DUF1610 family)